MSKSNGRARRAYRVWAQWINGVRRNVNSCNSGEVVDDLPAWLVRKIARGGGWDVVCRSTT